MNKLDTVVIAGGSIAGLLAARAAAPFANKVFIYERDTISVQRKGAPQRSQIHVLLKSGLDTIESMLPGFRHKLIEAGGVTTNATNDWASMFPKGWLHRFASDIEFICASRDLVEQVLRTFVLEQTPNIIFKEGYRWSGLQASLTKRPIVRVTEEENQKDHEIDADLFIDASGQFSKLPQFLKTNGFDQADTLLISAYLGYSTRLYKNVTLPENFLASLITPKPPHSPIGAALMPIENDTYMVSLYGFSANYPTTEEDAFLAELKTIRSDFIYEAIKDATPISNVASFRKDTNHLNRYGFKSWPMGVLAVGDSVCSPNPYYGQGMSGAAFAADEMTKVLRRSSFRGNWSQSLQRRIVRRNYQLWYSNSMEDLRWEKTTGMKRNGLTRSINRFVDRLLKASLNNRFACYAFVSALHMTIKPIHFLRPSLLLALIRGK